MIKTPVTQLVDQPNGIAGLDSSRMIATARVGSGTADATVFLRGDRTWATAGGISDGDYGDITVSHGGTVMDIDAGAVGNAELRDSAALSLIGRSANSVGAPADIASTADYDVMQNVGSVLAFRPLRIENRTVTDPAAPAVGQVWFRTDV